jgi:hypothetical protein
VKRQLNGPIRVGAPDTLDFTQPALAFGLGDPVEEVVADLHQPVALGGVWPQHRAPDTGVLVDARGPERPCAGPDGDFPGFEVAEELGPLLLGRGAIFLAGLQRPPAGQERPVGLDGFLGVVGLVSRA